MANIDEMFYEINCTTVRITYDIGQIGTYEVDFGLRAKVYEETFFGSLTKRRNQNPDKHYDVLRSIVVQPFFLQIWFPKKTRHILEETVAL